MSEKSTRKNLQEELIIAGIDELNKNGFKNFSVRRIASICGVSCAAPYKHFKDKNDFMASIIEYINFRWARRQLAIVKKYHGNIRKQLVEISLDYQISGSTDNAREMFEKLQEKSLETLRSVFGIDSVSCIRIGIRRTRHVKSAF